MDVLERGLRRWAEVVARATGVDRASTPGTGAAGGTGFAAVALLDARLQPGIELILELLDFDRTVTGADLVITGEGSLDEQSLSGKAPFGVAQAAGRAGVPVVAVAGRSLLAPADLHRAGVSAVYPLSDLEPDPARSIAQAASLLAIVGRRIATGMAPVTATFDLLIRGQVLTDDGIAERTVAVTGGRIAAVETGTAELAAVETVDLARDEVLIPGLVDTHVHVNEPGRTEWEGFATATRAAAAGGITTIVDMPLNSIPATTSVAALEAKRRAAEGQCAVDVAFWGGAVPDSIGHLADLHAAGVVGFKCFLLDSGVPEFPALDADQLRRAMTEIAAFDGLLIVHAEDAAVIEALAPPSSRHYSDFLASRPPEAEVTAIEQVIAAATETGCRTHIVHLSAAEALPAIRAARGAGVRLTVETCPHYLTLAAEDIADGQTQFKCCPPVRDRGNADRLWAALAAGDIDFVVSDHSPSTPELKRFDTGDFGLAWGGISSVQLALSLVWSGAEPRGHDLARVVEWMSARTAAFAGLPAKGAIAVGRDADLAVFAPGETWTVDPSALQHRHPVTAYAGRTVRGAVRATYLRGQRIDPSGEPRGALLTRSDRRTPLTGGLHGRFPGTRGA